jgi:hypothetical protein
MEHSDALQALFIGDKVIMTIRYCALKLLIGTKLSMDAKHYHKAVNYPAVECIVAELASLRPIYKTEAAKLDPIEKEECAIPDEMSQYVSTPSSKITVSNLIHFYDSSEDQLAN